MSPLKQQVGGTHYTDMQIQPWEVTEAWLTHEECRGYYWGTIIKYLGRWPNKGGVEDLKKAAHFLKQLIEHEEKQSKDNDNL